MVWSPNLVWLTIAVMLHILAPYDFAAAAKGFEAGWSVKTPVLLFAY
jgi:hypothetical protein